MILQNKMLKKECHRGYFSVPAILILLLSTQTFCMEKANLETLKLVQIIMRHGDRNPYWENPENPRKDDPTYWVGGYGALIDRGLGRTHGVGSFVRGRYGGFINQKYIAEELSAWSSDLPRTIQSGLSFLQGLYPNLPKNSNKPISPYIQSIGGVSQIVPMQTINGEVDYYIQLEAVCPRWVALVDEFAKNSAEARALTKKAKAIIETHTGLIVNFQNASDVFDYLKCQKLQNKTLPAWVTPEVLEFGDQFYGFYITQTFTNEMKKIMSGTTKLIVDNMADKIQEKSSLKLKFLSGHDETIAAFLNILDSYNCISPPYAAAVLIELHKCQSSEDYIVEIYYRNDTITGVLYKIDMPKCPNPCRFSDFVAITQSFFANDYCEICQFKSPNGAHSKNCYTKKPMQL